jgi:hypothetical protein
MINFSPLRTKRLNVKMKELTIGDTINLCKMPINLHEASTAEMLDKIVDKAAKKQSFVMADCRLWTVQERAMTIAHYIAQISPEPDFSIGDGKLSDYLMMDKIEVDSVKVGKLKGDNDIWMLHPLLGCHAEAIERLVNSQQIYNDRAGWWLGAMAAMLYREKEERDDEANDAQIEAEILKRAKTINAFPESSFMELLELFLRGIDQQNHFFKLVFLNDGIAFLPAGSGKEVQALPPARFLVSAAISEGAWRLFGPVEKESGGTTSLLQPTA